LEKKIGKHAEIKKESSKIAERIKNTDLTARSWAA